ncbi:MAG: LPXTG cell wall anchor domain-containing protein [Gammaproteobacteria bacterium]
MNIKMETTGLSLVIGGLLFAATTVAQDLDVDKLAATDENAASCAAVRWDTRLLAEYPRVAKACHEVIMVEGQKWARFETELVSVNRSGAVKSNFKDRQDNYMGAITIMPAHDQTVAIDGTDYRFSDLRAGQMLNVYVPEGMYAFSMAPGTPPAQVVEIVNEPEPVVAAAPVPARLPSTAGPLPWLALGGLFSLAGGIGFAIRRRMNAA